MRASDRAVLRFMERKLGVDVEAVRAQVEGVFDEGRMQETARWADGAPFRVCRDGMVFCCKDSTITTCYQKRRLRVAGATGGKGSFSENRRGLERVR